MLEKSSLWERGWGLRVWALMEMKDALSQVSREFMEGSGGEQGGGGRRMWGAGGVPWLGGIWNQRRLLAGTSSWLCPWEAEA